LPIFSGIVVYVIIWWVVLFMVLPWGAGAPETPGPGHATSAPERPRLALKAGVTTAIAAVLWLACYWVITEDLLLFLVD
jgi:predicted secreted protein